MIIVIQDLSPLSGWECENHAWLSSRFNLVCRYLDGDRLTARSFQDVSRKKVNIYIYINERRVCKHWPSVGPTPCSWDKLVALTRCWTTTLFLLQDRGGRAITMKVDSKYRPSIITGLMLSATQLLVQRRWWTSVIPTLDTTTLVWAVFRWYNVGPTLCFACCSSHDTGPAAQSGEPASCQRLF